MFGASEGAKLNSNGSSLMETNDNLECVSQLYSPVTLNVRENSDNAYGNYINNDDDYNITKDINSDEDQNTYVGFPHILL